jgi:hypothetical protein
MCRILPVTKEKYVLAKCSDELNIQRCFNVIDGIIRGGYGEMN